MRKSIISFAAVAVMATGAVCALPEGAFANKAQPAVADAATSHVLSFTTTMKSFQPIDVPPTGLSAGDGYVILGQPHSRGKVIGRATASCTFTYTKKPVIVVCTVDYALKNGIITTMGYSDTGGNPLTLVVSGGTGAFANARGFGKLQPTSSGSHVTLHLTG
jgi:hypothetical protein